MAYVGMSRPKYMLCYAMHSSRYDKALDIKNRGMWEVVEINNTLF
jgi:DNA helicase II / ATP-dependent DNA helicase PcrA